MFVFLFHVPNYVLSDRGFSFVSHELRPYLHSLGVATSTSSPYHPTGNAQVERYNGIIWKAVLCCRCNRRNCPFRIGSLCSPKRCTLSGRYSAQQTLLHSTEDCPMVPPYQNGSRHLSKFSCVVLSVPVHTTYQLTKLSLLTSIRHTLTSDRWMEDNLQFL